VNRGGSWNNNPGNCRVANRNNWNPDNRNNNVGFRLLNMFTGRTFFFTEQKAVRKHPGCIPAPQGQIIRQTAWLVAPAKVRLFYYFLYFYSCLSI